MVAATGNTEWPQAAQYTVTSYYISVTSTVSNTSGELSYSNDCGWANVNYYENNPFEWTPPRTAPRIDLRHDRSNKPLVLRTRHIAPMHFRHVRTQQRKT